MFEVGKKYRYTGKGHTSFNSRGLMEYMKEGEHEVESVALHKSIFSGNPLVSFTDDPYNTNWFLDPKDFEEVGEDTVFSVYQLAKDFGEKPENTVQDNPWALECDGKTEDEIEELGYITHNEWHVPKSEFVPYKRTTFKVGSYYKWNGGEHVLVVQSGEFWQTPHKVLSVQEDGTTQPLVLFEGAQCEFFFDIRDFDEVVSQQDKETLFVGFETLNNRHVILVVPKEDTDDKCGVGHTFGYVSFSEAGQFGYPNWFWGGDVYESLKDAVTALSRIDAEPIYFDSMKSLMKWATELL